MCRSQKLPWKSLKMNDFNAQNSGSDGSIGRMTYTHLSILYPKTVPNMSGRLYCLSCSHFTFKGFSIFTFKSNYTQHLENGHSNSQLYV